MKEKNLTRRHYTRYSEDFKLAVLKWHYENGMSENLTSRYFGLCGRQLLKKWMERYPITEKCLSLSAETIKKATEMSRKRKTGSPTTSAPKSELERLREENTQLRKALCYSELRVEAFETLIEVAEENEGVDILKKAGAKQR